MPHCHNVGVHNCLAMSSAAGLDQHVPLQCLVLKVQTFLGLKASVPSLEATSPQIGKTRGHWLLTALIKRGWRMLHTSCM